MFRPRRLAVAAAAMLLLSAAACGGPGVADTGGVTDGSASLAPAVSGTVSLGGFDLAYTCQGFGSPTVILEAGLGTGGIEEFRTFLPRVASITRVCTYDRAGLGTSDRRPSGGTAVPGRELARETHLLFAGLGIHPPYVLVGHSFGGLLVRAQAAAYPGDAAGMVLIDAANEQEAAYYRSLGVDPWLDQTSRIDMPSIVTLLRDHPSLGSIPLVVVTAGIQDNPVLRKIPRRVARFQDRLATLSANSIHVTATGSGHFVQDDDPALVVAAIREVVDAVRNASRLPGCGAVFPQVGGACP